MGAGCVTSHVSEFESFQTIVKGGNDKLREAPLTKRETDSNLISAPKRGRFTTLVIPTSVASKITLPSVPSQKNEDTPEDQASSSSARRPANPFSSQPIPYSPAIFNLPASHTSDELLSNADSIYIYSILNDSEAADFFPFVDVPSRKNIVSTSKSSSIIITLHARILRLLGSY